jgi:uncharacterized membrane protein YcjF (UPF0283 family)
MVAQIAVWTDDDSRARYRRSLARRLGYSLGALIAGLGIILVSVILALNLPSSSDNTLASTALLAWLVVLIGMIFVAFNWRALGTQRRAQPA